MKRLKSLFVAALIAAASSHTLNAEAPEAVDLGLSVRWAPFNIGASGPQDAGAYYGWGEPTGTLTAETLSLYPSPNPPASICSTPHDIATASWGQDWRMPTQAEFEELASRCVWQWGSLDGVNGMTVTGPNGNSIFLPAAASRTGSQISGQAGQRGCYWSGTLWAANNDFASYLYFYSNAGRVQPARSNRRYVGMPVRAVENSGNSGVDDIIFPTDSFAVSADGALTVHIAGLDDDTAVTITDMTGRTVYSGTGRRLTLHAHGVYIVIAGGNARKISL